MIWGCDMRTRLLSRQPVSLVTGLMLELAQALLRRLAQEGFHVDPCAPILMSLNVWTRPSGHSISGCFHGYT